MIQEIKRFQRCLEANVLTRFHGAAESSVYVEEIETAAGVSTDEGSIDHRPGGRALHSCGPSRNIEGQCRVILQHRAQLKPVADRLPDGVRRSGRRLDDTVKDEPVTLVIIRPSIVLPDLEIVDRRTEEEFSYIVESLGVRVGNSVVTPARWTLNKRNV